MESWSSVNKKLVKKTRKTADDRELGGVKKSGTQRHPGALTAHGRLVGDDEAQ